MTGAVTGLSRARSIQRSPLEALERARGAANLAAPRALLESNRDDARDRYRRDTSTVSNDAPGSCANVAVTFTISCVSFVIHAVCSLPEACIVTT